MSTRYRSQRRELALLRADLRRQHWTYRQIAAHLHQTRDCGVLLSFRLAHGLTQEQVASRLNEIGGNESESPTTITGQQICYWEAWPGATGRPPALEDLRRLAHVYACDIRDLIEAHDFTHLDPETEPQSEERHADTRGTLSILGAGVTFDISQDFQTCTSDEQTQLAFADITTFEELERLVTMAAHRSFRFSSRSGGNNIGEATLEDLRQEVRRLGQSYQLLPLDMFLGDLILVQDAVFRLLEGHQKPAQTQELYVLAGMVTGLLANASHDVGNNASALVQARTAFLCADNADHDGLRAWVRGVQSMIAYWAGMPSEALRYVEMGSTPAKRISGSAAAWLPSLRARAWGQLGNAEEVRQAIDEALTARDHVRENDLDEIGGKFTFPLPRQLYYASDASAWLSTETDNTKAWATQAIAAYEAAPEAERSFVDESVARTDAAIAFLDSGEIDGAEDSLRPVLDLAPAERVGGILVNTTRIAQALRNSRFMGDSAARGLRDELEGFGQATASRILHAQ